MIAWRLVIFRRPPFSATITGSFGGALSWKGDRGQQGLDGRRQIDDRPPDPALAHLVQLGDDLELPIYREVGVRIEVLEAAPGEVAKSCCSKDT